MLPEEKRLDERFQVPIENTVHVTHFTACPVILYHAVGMQDIGSDLASPGDLLLIPMQFFLLLLLQFFFSFIEPCFEHFHGNILVAMLGTLILALDDNFGRQVSDADGRTCFINMLAAGSAGPVRVYAQILFVDVDIDIVVKLRKDENRGKRGVPPTVDIKGGNADQPVDAISERR